MKKHLLLLPFLLLNYSCQEEVNGFNSLTEAEREAIRNRGQEACKEKAEPIFKNFKTKSNDSFRSSSYKRGNVFTYEFKDGETVTKTVEFKVWKQTTDALYFIVSDSKSSSDYFLRLTTVDNERIIHDLQQLYCTRPGIYSMASGKNGPLSAVNEYELPKAPNKEFFKDTYNFVFNAPAFLGSYELSREIKVKDKDNREVGTTKNLTTNKKQETFQFASVNWNDANEYSQKFCTIEAAAGYRLSRERNVEGFKLDSENCTNVVPAEWDLDI